MSYSKKSPAKFVALIISAMFFGLLAIWQFYFFLVFRDITGGPSMWDAIAHLCYAVGLAIISVLVPFLIGLIWTHRDRAKEIHFP